MANINSIITYNANLSPAQAQIKALAGQVAGLTTAFNSLDAAALKAQRSVAATFAANIGQIGGFTAQTVKATTAVETFGKRLAANKLTMREYFREATMGYIRQNSLMRQLAEQQVRYQQSIAVPTGGGQAMMLTPQSINAASNAAQLASQRFSIFNQLVSGGATAMLNWGKNTQWAGRQLMVGFTLPLALFAGVMSKQFRELDMELTRFQKVYGSDLGNAITESTQKMRDQVQQLAYDISAAYGIAAKETAALAADIAATGREGEELMASVQQTTRLAVLGEVGRQEAMKATLSLQSAFRMNTDELAESINFLNAVENQTSATLQDLATAIPKVGPVVRALGGDVKDLATLLVAMREGGIPAAEAANALKSGLASLINPTKQASMVAKQFGVDLVGIVEANQGQLMPTIYAMQSALAGLDSFSRSRIIEQIFGKYQFARISALFDNIGRTGSQTQAVIELATKSSAELAAVANGEIKTLTESTAVKFQRTLEQLKNSLMPIAQTLTETLIPVLEKVGEGVKMFSTFFSSLPESVKGLAKWGVALTALAGPVIMLVGLFGNLIANGLKFGMMVVRLGAKMAGIKTEKFQLLDENLMAAKLGVDNLTSAFTTQEVAMKRLVGVLAAYEQSLARMARTNPALFIPGAVPGARGAVPIRRQKGSTAPERVPGGYGGGDRIPALLEPGESVITKEATAKFWPVIEAMNRGNLPGFNRGTIFLGMPNRFQKGGKVPGGYGGGDKVPAYLEPGEFVITKEATKLNKSFLEAINSGKKPGMYKTGKDTAGGSGQGDISRAAKLHTVSPDELGRMYYGSGSKSMLGVLGYGGLTTTLHPQYLNNTFDKLTGVPSWMKSGIPFNDRAAAQMLSVLIKERDLRVGKVGPEFTRSIQYLQKLIKSPGKARSVTLNGYAATTAAAERLAGIIPDTDKSQKARAQQLAAELNKRVGSTTSPGRIFSTINRLSMEYIDKALADPSRRSLIWESTPGTSKTKFKDSLRERLPKFAQSGFLFRGIRLGRFQKGGVGSGEPALLEPGEFVVNSDASAKYAPVLRAMNRGTLKGYENGRDPVSLRPGYDPKDPKYSSPYKTPTGGRHQGHIFGAPVAPGIPAFGKNLQIGGQAVFWHADFWKMITAAENQLANVLAMSAPNRAKLMESLSIVGPQFNASQQQIDRIMLAVTNGFMQHEDDVALYQAALRNLGQRVATGAASVSGALPGLIKQVESIKITGYSPAEAKAVETRLITEYQRILSTPGKLAEAARIAIAKQLQLVQQQMATTGIATTQMTSSLATSVQASAGRPFPQGVLAPVRSSAGSSQLAGTEQSLIKAMQLRERVQRRLIISSERLEKLEAAEARVKADTTLSEQKRKVALDNLSRQYYEELRNKEVLEKASVRAEQNLIRAKERAAASYATTQPTTAGGTPSWLRQRMDMATRTGPTTSIIPALGVMPTGPSKNMQDPMARAMRGQGLMNVAFMGSMLVGSLGAMGGATEDVTSKLMMLSMALMALPMLQMMNPRGMATNFLGLRGLGERMQGAGMARAAAAGGGISSNIATRGLNAGPGSGLFGAGARIGALGGPKGIVLAMGITAIVAAYMLYKKAADEARERAIASFEDPAKSAEYFGETIDNLSQELENRSGRFKIGDMVDIDPELRKIVGEEYAPLIDRLKYSQAEDGARQLSLAYNNMLINGLSAENAQATLKAIAAEAGAQGGAAYSEAFSNSMLNAENVEEAITKQMDLLNPERNKALVEKLQSQLPALDAAVAPARMDSTLAQFKLFGEGLKDIASPGSGPLNIFRMFSSGDPAKEGMEIAGEFFGGFNKVWTAATADIFDSTVEARAADAASNAADQAKTSIEELMSLSADSFNAATTDFMKAYEDAPQKVLESIQTAATWVEATDDNLEIMKTGLIELNPILEGLIRTLETPAEVAIFKQLLTVGLDPAMFFDENGFNEAAAATSAATMGFYDELDKKNKESFDELKENTVDFIDEEIKAVNKGIRKINQYWDNLSKLARKEQRQAQKDYDQAQKRSEKFIDAKQDEIEAIQDVIDSRREEFDERMQGLQDEKDLIEESTDKYIDSLNKRKEADSFYAQQRKTSISALQKLAAGDVFGFLQDREQMSADAQTFSYDQMISDIEDRRDLEVDAIDETMEKERRRQEEWEKAQRDKIDGINDLIDAERDLMDERTKAHEKDLRQFEKRQKEYDRGRKQELKDERIKLADLTKAREKAESLEIADYEEMSKLLGEKYKDRYDKQIYQLQREQFFVRYNMELYKEKQEMATNANYTPRSNEDIIREAFTGAFGKPPGPAQGGALAATIAEILRQMGIDPNNPEITLNNQDAPTPGRANGGLMGGGKVSGPGGPKSDVIPAMLSNGEYVVQASSVKKYGTDLMNTINAGKFAYGGYISADRAETADRGNVYGGTPRPKPKTTYSYTPGAQNPVTRYNSPTRITGYPPNLTSYFDTNRRYQNKNTPDNNYKAHGIYSGRSYVPYAQDALDARNLPDGYSGGKKWRENMSRLTNLGLNSSEFFDQWRNLRRWEKEQFIRSLDNVSINQPPPTIIRDSRDTSRPIRPPGDYRSEETYNNNWWTNYESKAKAYVRSLPGGADKWMIQHFNDTDGHHAYRIIPRGPDNRPWWQKMFIPAYDDGAGHLKGIYDDDGTRWPNKGDKGTAVDYGWANGGIVGFKNGSSNPTWYSADRREQEATGTRGQSTKPYRGTTATTYTPTGTPMRPAGPYTYTPNWNPGNYNLPPQRYGPYGVGRIPGTRKPYNKPEFGRTADLSATLASNYSHKLDAYASIYKHLEYFRQKAGQSPYVPGYGYVNIPGGGNKWQSITNLLSSPLGAGARDRLTGSARDIPTLDYWRTLSREQKAWFLEYATTGNTNNWSNSRIFKLMPWLPKETEPEPEPEYFSMAANDRLKSHFPYLPMPMRGPGTSPMPLKQHDQAPTSTWVPNWNESGIVAPTDPYGGWVPVVGDTAQPGYPDTGARGTYGRKDWGWPWDGSGTKDNAQSPIRFRPGMTPGTTRTSPQERYPIGMSGIYLGTSTWIERTLGKLSSGQPLSLVEKSSLNNLYERLSPTEKRLLVSEVYKRSMPSRESISLRSLNEMSSVQRGATLRTLGNETGYEFDLIRRRNGGLVQKFAGGGLAGPNGWPYSAAAGGPGFPMASGTIPGTSVGITMNKNVLPLFLAFASDYNKMIKPIKGSMTGGYDVRGAPEETFSNHPSGTALDINWNEEGSHYSYMLGNDPARTKANFEWWKGNKSTLAPWDSLSPVPYQTMRSLIDKYKVLQWFGPSSLGGPNWLSWSSTDPMHVQLNQDTDPTLNDVISVMNSLGIKPDGTGASGTAGTAETPGTPTAENKTERQEKAPPRMGLSSILKQVGSVEAETSTDTTTTTNTEAGSGGGWLRSFIASKGISGEVAKTLWAIGMKESGGDPGKLYPQKSSYDWNSSGFPRFDTGLFQINNIHLDKIKNAFGRNATMQDMLDPEKNWTIMEQLSSNFTKWNPWGIATDMVSPDWTGWPATTWSKEESFNRYMDYRNQFADGGIVKMFAAGGKVRGPGGPRSDMIPAMLSNGEYVVKASSVAKYGKGFMDKVNAGQLNFGGGGMAAKYANGGMVNPARFADGGFVGSMASAPMPTFGMPQMTSVSPTDISSSINNVGGSSNSSSSNTSNVKVIINGAGGKSAKAIANRVISIINEANGRRNHSRSI